MTTVALNPQLASYFKSIEGRTNDDKLLRLLETYLASQMRTCEQEISQYEVKYRATFAEFARSWEQDEIPGKHTHTVERDYMEWEGLVAEKQNWLQRLRNPDLHIPIAVPSPEEALHRLHAAAGHFPTDYSQVG